MILELQLHGAIRQAHRAADQHRQHEIRAPAKTLRIIA
jgi:hypothetical protein